jgi:hypothetical protein
LGFCHSCGGFRSGFALPASLARARVVEGKQFQRPPLLFL